METQTLTGTVDDTEDSDVSLLIVSENTAGDDADLSIPDTVLADGTASNPVLEMGMERTCPASEATTAEAVVVTRDDASCPRHRRRLHRHRRSVCTAVCCLLLNLMGEVQCAAVYL